jgi:hypothetical protein
MREGREAPVPERQTSISLTAEETALVADAEFFHAKAGIMTKIRAQLEEVRTALREELAGAELLAPPGFDPTRCQFVKGEHLEDCPYQYLDYPKHFSGDEKFTFRTMFWWGHYYVFAFILEGRGLLQYKRNLINRYREVADRDICLCLGPSPWDWRWGDGYTLALSGDRRPEVGAVLSARPFFKLARFLRHTDAAASSGQVPTIARETLRAVLPVIRA